MTISRPDEGWHDAINRLYNESDEAKRLEEAKKKAIEAFARMTPLQQARMRRLQRESWVRGEMAIGSDADEARARDRAREEGEK